MLTLRSVLTLGAVIKSANTASSGCLVDWIFIESLYQYKILVRSDRNFTANASVHRAQTCGADVDNGN